MYIRFHSSQISSEITTFLKKNIVKSQKPMKYQLNKRNLRPISLKKSKKKSTNKNFIKPTSFVKYQKFITQERFFSW